MNLILFALRRPISVVIALVAIFLVAVVALGLGSFLGIQGMPIDVFPSLNLPVIYVCQPYGGMDPAQMEGYLANYYEYHFLYITGIHHVESRNIQGLSLMKLFFHPGTNMAQAMAETVSYVNRARAFMPPGTVSPFVMRFDTGSVPVGYLVFSSETRSIGEIQDLALMRVRPMFANLPGVSAPPPFGGNQRTVVITVDPQRLRAYDMTPDDVVSALAQGNTISPSGNLPSRASTLSCRSTRWCATSATWKRSPCGAGPGPCTSGTWATSRTRRTLPRAMRWPTVAGPSTFWSQSVPMPRPTAWSTP